MNYLEMELSALVQGLLYAPMAIGVYISSRVLNTADLTIDGSFVFGMAVCAMITVAGYPVMGIASGIIGGGIAGWLTGFMQTKLQVNPMLSGILTMTSLYTVNYMVLGEKANLYLQTMQKNATGVEVPVSSMTIYRMFGTSQYATAILTAIISIIVTAGLIIFFKTRTGMAIRATGDNEEMVRSSSINAGKMRRIGIVITNGLVGLSGALVCQQQRYADLSSGAGTLVVGLASVIIGTAAFGRRSVTAGIISAILGSVIYRIILQGAYLIDMPSYMVKMLSAVVVLAALTLPLLRKLLKETKMRQRNEKEVIE